MSSNYRPTNMFGSYNNRLPQGKINPTKGIGINSFQVGNTSTNIRPYFNKDYLNDSPAPFGKPRPLKLYRRGRVIPQYIQVNNPENNNEQIEIDFNALRVVKSAVQDKMVSQMLWLPGAYSITPNNIEEVNGIEKTNNDCINCKATTVISNWKPTNNLSEKPEANVENKLLCCNQEYKARKRVLPASTITQRNYYTTNYQYLQNRCQTYDQRVFNFKNGTTLSHEIIRSILSSIVSNPDTINYLISSAKPGSPLSYFNLYVAQCQPNGAILEATIIFLIIELNLMLLNRGLINQLEYDLLITLGFKTLETYIQFFNNTFPKPQADEIGKFIFDVIDNNKTLSEIIEGPTNSSGCEGCGRVYYKPNNYNFSVQGAVMSSLRTLQLNVDTIEKNSVMNKKINNYVNLDGNTNSPFIYKSKYGSTCYNPRCGKPIPKFDANPLIGV